MEETIKKYREYNFSLNSAWQEYYKNLYPPPSIDLVEKLKRKWYKKNLDSNLPLDFDQNNSSSQQPQEGFSGQGQPNPTFQARNESTSSAALFKIEGYMKLAFIPGLILLSGFHLKLLASVICLLAMVRNFGLPKFNKEYFIKVVPSEFFSNLLYILSISLTNPQNGFLFFLPIAIHLSSGIVEFVGRTNPTWFSQYPKLNQTAGIIKNNRNALIIAKHKVEFCIFIYLILLCFLGRSSLFQLILYIQFLNLKFKFNANMPTAIWELRNYLVGSQNIPALFRNAISKFFELFMKAMNLF